MSQAATTADQGAASVTSMSFETVESAWRRNLQAGAQATRALQAENTQFARRLLDLNLRAARAFGAPPGCGDHLATPFQLGACAVELYFEYLGRTAALARHAIARPWRGENA